MIYVDPDGNTTGYDDVFTQRGLALVRRIDGGLIVHANTDMIETVMGAVVLVVAAMFLAFAYNHSSLRTVSGYEVVARFDRVDMAAASRLPGRRSRPSFTKAMPGRTESSPARS